MKHKPNLFIVGEPKSGTTALASFLDEHPNIFISKPKEPHFFCRDFHKEAKEFYKSNAKEHYEFQNLDEYMKIYLGAKNEKVLGEASTHYLYSKTSAKEIKEFNPEAKIIAIFREPVSFLHSLHMQYVNDTSENEQNFERALDLEKARKKGKHISKRVRSPSYLFYSETIKYADQIERFTKLFPKRQIKIIIFDDYKKDNPKIYKEVLEFLEVDSSFKPDFKGVHESKQPKSKLINSIFRNPFLKSIPKSLMSANGYDKLQLRVQKMIMKKEERNPLDSELRKKLMKKYKPEVVKLEKLLHKHKFIPRSRSLIKEWSYDKV